MRGVLRWAWLVAVVNGITGLAPWIVMANDMAFGGAGADLVPLAENRVQMVSEDILIERRALGGYQILGEGDWRVLATYRFRNLTSESVDVQIGFPEPACPEDSDCDFTGFTAMTTTVRSEPVELTVGTVDPGQSWAEHIGRVYLFAVRFAPHETVEVIHRYHHGLSEYVNGGEDLTYLTRTGAQWAGSIENARFRIRLPFRPWGLSLGEWGTQLVKFTEQRVDEAPQIEFHFQWTHWEPRQDLKFTIGPGQPTLETPSLIAGCPAHGELFESDFDLTTLDFVEIKDRTQALSNDQLRLCRNAIFAHHGKDFDDPALDQFFYGKHGLQIHTDAASHNSAVFARNPHFSANMLTTPETAYIKAIQQLERAR
jgi:hypothetical protein